MVANGLQLANVALLTKESMILRRCLWRLLKFQHSQAKPTRLRLSHLVYTLHHHTLPHLNCHTHLYMLKCVLGNMKVCHTSSGNRYG